MSVIRLGRFQPSGDVAEARMLRASGSLTLTASSRRTGRHLTLRIRCARHDPDGVKHWPTVAFDEATHVFIDDFDGENVATLDPVRGVVRFSPRATTEARWTVEALLRYFAGANSRLLTLAELATVAHCRRCDRELTDPHSIERGFGADCFGEGTSSWSTPALAGQAAG